MGSALIPIDTITNQRRIMQDQANQPTNTTYTLHSILENGQMIDGKHPVGSVRRTKWGMCKVVANVSIPVKPVDHITLAEIAQRIQ